MEAKSNTPATPKPVESSALAAMYERKEAARKAAWRNVEEFAAYRDVVSASYDF